MPPVRSFAALGLFVHEGFLSDSEWRAIAGEMLSDAGEQATIFDKSASAAVAPDVRRAWEVDVAPDHQLLIAERLRELQPALAAHFATALGDSEPVSFLRYPEGAFYRIHRDRRETVDPTHAERRAVSVVVFVNGAGGDSGFSGGHLRFYGLLGEGELADIG